MSVGFRTVDIGTTAIIAIQFACIPSCIPILTASLRWSVFLLLDQIRRPFGHCVRSGLNIPGWLHGEDTSINYTKVRNSVDFQTGVHNAVHVGWHHSACAGGVEAGV